MILVIDRRDAVVRYKNGNIHVAQGDSSSVLRAPIKQLEHVIVYGNPMAETQVWRHLAAAGVPVVMLALRGDLQATMLGSGLATQLGLRRMQHRCANNDSAALKIATWFVKAKLKSYELSLKTLKNKHSAEKHNCDAFQEQCTRTIEKLSDARHVSSLMGLEGQVAHAWFTLLAKHLPYCWKFAGRNRRPPQDPVNSLLSLGYTLLMSELRQMLIASGFDPSLGFLHQDAPARESLVLDFAEIFRSGVDDFVLHWIEDSGVTSDSFYYRDKEGCRLAKTTRPLFFEAWASAREAWPRPLLSDDNQDQWPSATLREQINGQIANLREFMKPLKVSGDG